MIEEMVELISIIFTKVYSPFSLLVVVRIFSGSADFSGFLNLASNILISILFKIFIHFQLILSKNGPEVIKLFTYSTQLSSKFILLINVKMDPSSECYDG